MKRILGVCWKNTVSKLLPFGKRGPVETLTRMNLETSIEQRSTRETNKRGTNLFLSSQIVRMEVLFRFQTDGHPYHYETTRQALYL